MEQNEKIDKQELWRQRLADLSASGMTQKEWCQQQQISFHTLRYWKRKLKSEEAGAQDSHWMSVVPGITAPVDSDLEITLRREDVTIILPPMADPKLSHALLQVLMQS